MTSEPYVARPKNGLGELADRVEAAGKKCLPAYAPRHDKWVKRDLTDQWLRALAALRARALDGAQP